MYCCMYCLVCRLNAVCLSLTGFGTPTGTPTMPPAVPLTVQNQIAPTKKEKKEKKEKEKKKKKGLKLLKGDIGAPSGFT